MGGVNSCASAEEIENANATGQQILLPLLDEINDNMTKAASAIAGSAPAKNLLQMAMSSLKSMDEGVMKFISQCKKSILQDNYDILNAYYDASRKAQDAALEVQRHADLSIVQLKNLKGMVRTYRKGTERSCELALKELEQVNEEEINLPQSLVGKLEEAKAAYEKLIRVCDKAVKHLKESSKGLDTLIWKVVGGCCVIVLGVAICSLAPPLAPLVAVVGGSTSSTAAAAAGFAVGIAGAVGGAALTDRIRQISNLSESIIQQQVLLERAKRDTEQILTAIIPLKVKVRELQGKVGVIATDTSRAKRLEDMEDITGDSFEGLLDTQLQELQSLSRTCDELCAEVDKAYELFKEKSGFITQRVLRGENLY